MSSKTARGATAFLTILMLVATPSLADNVVYVSRGASWKYLRGLEEASSPDTMAWTASDFDDDAWAVGPAPFGYGDPPFGVDLSLLSPPMRSNYTTLYLRSSFEVADAGAVVELDLEADYDDGFVLWINGLEVFRANVGNPLSHDATANNPHESGTYEEFPLPSPGIYLHDGVNTVAVQVFNSSLTSSDLKFDMELFDPFGPDLTPPAVQSVVPAPGAVVRTLDEIQVTFSEEVTGLDAADLLIHGVAAASVSGGGKGPYVFRFAEPSPGEIDVSWAAGAAIGDAADPPNLLAGGSWSYTLDPDAPEADLIISEFLAASGGTLRDEDGDLEDWVEVYNRGAVPADLAGWSVSDEADERGKWVFPAVTLDPGEYLVVFASGKDRRPTSGANLHTNFQLNADGEYLGLFPPESPRNPVSEFAPVFPPQRPGFSCGLDGAGQIGYFDPPTPGSPNGAAAVLSGIVDAPKIRPPRGFYSDPVQVEISTATPGSRIYYTVNGRDPTPSTGTEYTEPFEVNGSAARAVIVVRAAAYKTGFLPSTSVAQTFIYPRYVPRQPANPQGFPTSWGGAPAVDYAMDPQVVDNPAYSDMVLDGLLAIPTLSIAMETADMFGPSGIYSNPTGEGVQWERPASVELLYPSGKNGFAVTCGLRIQGGASRQPNKSPKHSLRLLFKGDYGPTKLRFPFFPDSKVDSFDTITLRANYNNSWIHWDTNQRKRGSLIRDQWARDTQLAMGRLSSHGTYMHVYVNGLYWGVYNPVERPSAPFAASYLGGEREEYDALNSGVAVDGDRTAWNAMMSRASAGLSSNAQYEGIQEYLDVPGLIDYMIFNIYGANDDWPHHNWYAVRRRQPGSGYRFASWDAERILEGVTSNKTGVNNSDSAAFLYSKLRANAEFRLLFADHLHRHFFGGGVLTPEAAAARWMARAAELDKAVVCESARWGDYRRDVHSYSNGPYEFYTRNDFWIVEQSRLLTQYFPLRSSRVLDQFRAIGLYPDVGAPLFQQQGGTIEPGFSLVMSLPGGTSGTIYFTTDGSDPRVYGSGDVSPQASAYGSPVALSDTTRVRARTLSGGEWSAENEAVFSVLPPAAAVRITEIMYHPAEGSAYEFVEIGNAAASAVDLTGLEFTSGIGFSFAPGTILRPGEYIVLVRDYAAFSDKYPGVAVDGVFTGGLDNGGEKLTLKDSQGRVVTSVDYNDAGFWPVAPDGFGYSLVELTPDGDPDSPWNWGASSAAGGSPGRDDPPSLYGGVVINEVIAHTSPPLEDAVELLNESNRTVDVGGWYLSDARADANELRKFRIPDGTSIAPGGFLVLYEQEFNEEPGTWPAFDLDEHGGSVYLSATNGAGEITGYIVGRRFGAGDEGVSFGRYATSDGLDFTAMEAPTFGIDNPASLDEFRTGKGAVNAFPLVGPVVIHEIQYHPAAGDDEFVELHNLTGAAVALDGWHFDGVGGSAGGTGDYEFPPGTEIPAGGFVVIAGAAPDGFRDRYAVPEAVPVVGPYPGSLDNGGESLRLLKPGSAAGDLVVVDRIRYNDKEPWPVDADGIGPTLERVRASEYGNDPLNWGASLDDAGTPGHPNSVSQAGVNQRPVAAFSAVPQAGALAVLLDASASRDPDGQIVGYAWELGDGTEGEGETFLHTFGKAGTYVVRLTVEDNDGATSVAARSVTLSGTAEGGLQRPGDVNQDGDVDISDAVSLLLHLFVGTGGALPCDGGTLLDGGNKTLVDINQDDSVDLTDAVYTLNYLFRGGEPPVLGTGCIPIAGCPDACVP